MPETTDRRVRRTRRALIQALFDLLNEEPYPSIQVRDITERADVGYATFYRHFECKDDLFAALFTHITTELEADAASQPGDYFQQEGRLIFEHVRRYAGFYRSIAQHQVFSNQLKGLLAAQIEEHLRKHKPAAPDGNGNPPAIPLDLAAHHMAVATIGLIDWWLGHKMQPAADEMAEMYNRLVIQATWVALDPTGGMNAAGHRHT